MSFRPTPTVISRPCFPLNPQSRLPSDARRTKLNVCARYPFQSHRARPKNPPAFPNEAPQSVTAYQGEESAEPMRMISLLLPFSPSRASLVSQFEVSMMRILSPPSSRVPTNGFSTHDQVPVPS